MIMLFRRNLMRQMHVSAKTVKTDSVLMQFGLDNPEWFYTFRII